MRSHDPALPCVELVCHRDRCPVQRSCMQLFHIHPVLISFQSKSERHIKEPTENRFQKSGLKLQILQKKIGKAMRTQGYRGVWGQKIC